MNLIVKRAVVVLSFLTGSLCYSAHESDYFLLAGEAASLGPQQINQIEGEPEEGAVDSPSTYTAAPSGSVDGGSHHQVSFLYSVTTQILSDKISELVGRASELSIDEDTTYWRTINYAIKVVNKL